MKLLYHVDEVAKILSLSRSGIYELLKRGELIAYNPNPERKGLRVTAESINTFVKKHKITTDEFKN